MSKICKSCFRDLPIENFYFKDKNKTYRHNSCKECKRLYEKQRRENFPNVKIRGGGSREVTSKVCKICKLELSREFFYEHTDSRRKGVLAANCRLCNTERLEKKRKSLDA